MRVYSNSLEDKNKCAEIVVRAERLMGEMLKEEGRHRGGKPSIIDSHDGSQSKLPSGISYNQSSRWQRTASVPAKERKQYFARARERREEITTAGVLRLANSLKRDERARP